MSLTEWADAFVFTMSTTVSLPQLDSSQDFERWAGQIVNDPTLQALQLPQPVSADLWQSWAEGVNSAIASSGSI